MKEPKALGDKARSRAAGAGVTCVARESPYSTEGAIDWQGPSRRGGRNSRRILE